MTNKILKQIISNFEESFNLLNDNCNNQNCKGCPFLRETHCAKMLSHIDNVNYLKKHINKGEKNASNK